MARGTFACKPCPVDRAAFDYKYKGNVMKAYGVTYISEHKNDKEETDTLRFYRSYDKQHNCLVWSNTTERCKGYSFYKFGVFNGEWKLTEMKISLEDITRADMECVYSENGELIEAHYPNMTIHYNSDEREYCRITYDGDSILKHEYTYYDQRGNDTAIVVIDHTNNTTHHTKKRYFFNQKGHPTEVYKNDTLIEYYKYDSAGIPIVDSCKMGSDKFISFKYEEAGGKATYEYYDGYPESITRYDAKGNKIYSWDDFQESFMKYDEKNKLTERKTNYFDEDSSISKVTIELYKEDDYCRMEYKHDKLVSIESTKKTRTPNEEIITKTYGRDMLYRGFNTDTTITRTTFDSNGNILSIKEFRNSTLMNQIKYTYNEQGKLLSIESGKSHETRFENFLIHNEWEGILRHNKIEEIPQKTIDFTLGYELLTYNKKIYKYDEQGNLQSVTVQNGNAIKVIGQYVKDRLVSIKIKTDRGTLLVATYTYDSVGNITKQTIDSKGVKRITKTTFDYYDN